MVISTSILLDFSNLGYSEWSLRHAFFADMGGFVLNSSDYSQLPVNACQVCYLVANGFMRFPTVDSETIWDKNKADAFARVLTSVQVLWFAFQCIGRAAQHLPISTFELDTVAFILCTFPTFYYWRRKPLDVSTPITLFLHDGVQVRDILLLAGKSASRPFRFTPLDFANPTPDPYEVWDFNMWAVQLLFGFDADSKRKPVSTFRNSSRMASGRTGIINYSVISVFAISHVCIHLIAWNFHFPTSMPLARGHSSTARIWLFLPPVPPYTNMAIAKALPYIRRRC